LIDSNGFASQTASKRHKVTPLKLKGLMRSKSIGTISKKKMTKYESHVDTVLQNNRATYTSLPMTQGIDSRWNMVSYLPTIGESRPPDGAFPIWPSKGGKIEPHVPVLRQWPGLEKMKDPKTLSDTTSEGSHERQTSSTENDDWLGMIDPFMLDLMLMDDVGGDGKDVGNLDDLPPV